MSRLLKSRDIWHTGRFPTHARPDNFQWIQNYCPFSRPGHFIPLWLWGHTELYIVQMYNEVLYAEIYSNCERNPPVQQQMWTLSWSHAIQRRPQQVYPRPREMEMTNTLVTTSKFKLELRRGTESMQLGLLASMCPTAMRICHKLSEAVTFSYAMLSRVTFATLVRWPQWNWTCCALLIWWLHV